MKDIFCQIIAGDAQAFHLFENNHVVACLDIEPASPGHTLVVPKRHVNTLAELRREERAALMEVASVLSEAIQQVFTPDGVQLLVNNSASLQDVDHLHMHVMGKFLNDQGVYHETFPSKEALMEQLAKDQSKLTEWITSQMK